MHSHLIHRLICTQAGTWDVEQTLTRAEAPLGLKFIGGPRGDIAIAQKSLDEQRSRIGQPQQPV